MTHLKVTQKRKNDIYLNRNVCDLISTSCSNNESQKGDSVN